MLCYLPRTFSIHDKILADAATSTFKTYNYLSCHSSSAAVYCLTPSKLLEGYENKYVFIHSYTGSDRKTSHIINANN